MTGGAATGGAATGTGGFAIGGSASGGGGALTTGGFATGGAPMGGFASGGAPTGGLATGGAPTGGVVAGGSATGGLATGGSASGGFATGGLATGGAPTGGVATGGAETGGAPTGGVATGGAETGGLATGGMDTGGTGTGGVPVLSAQTIYVAGDSTVSNYTDTASPNDQAGWGQMLHEIFDDAITVDNRARGGRTALWFHLEGGVADILATIQPGESFFIQFGTNDSHPTATFEVDGVTYPRFADAQTDFKAHLKDYYLDPTRAAGAIPVLVTPPPRNSAYCGTGNSLGGYAQAMRELGAAEGVAVLDLNQKTFDYLAAICPAPTPEDFFFVRDDGSVDGTHFQENGARHMAAFLGEAIAELDLALAGYLLP